MHGSSVCACTSVREEVIKQLSLEMSMETRRKGKRERAGIWVWLLQEANLSKVSHLEKQQGTEEDLFVSLRKYKSTATALKNSYLPFFPLKTFNTTCPWKSLIYFFRLCRNGYFCSQHTDTSTHICSDTG